MRTALSSGEVDRVLVVLPNWVGDVVLATPTLRAVRAHFSAARVAFLIRPYVGDVIDGAGWHDELIHWPRGRGVTGLLETVRFAAALRRRRFDLSLLLTNSFRAALVIRLAGIPRRVGYARDGRGWLLTDRLYAPKRNGEFIPASVLPYYAAIAERAGVRVPDRRLTLVCTPEQESAARELRRIHGLSDDERYAVINPGAAFGAAKCWLPERFAAVCDRLASEHNLRCVLVGAPNELPLLHRIRDTARSPLVCFENPGTSLGSLKAIIRGAALLVCNDTGPRHYGNAFGIPTVTIFGPTDSAWTETDYDGEIELQARVDCGPCQLPRCPLDHRCMKAITDDHVLAAARELLVQPPGARAQG